MGGLGDLLGNVPLLGGVIKGITGTVDCSKVQLDQSILCEDPIIIRLPSVLNLGKVSSQLLRESRFVYEVVSTIFHSCW